MWKALRNWATLPENSRVCLAGIDLGDGEAVAGEPGFDGGDVLVGRAELRAELVGREPLVVAGEPGVCMCAMSWRRAAS